MWKFTKKNAILVIAFFLFYDVSGISFQKMQSILLVNNTQLIVALIKRGSHCISCIFERRICVLLDSW